MSQSEKKFLIRSAGQILGPFAKEEVTDLIKKGHISVFDEVAEPFSIWRYLQDHQDFKQIVYSMDVQTRLTNFITQISGKFSSYGKNAPQTKTQTDTLETDQTTKPFPLKKPVSINPPGHPSPPQKNQKSAEENFRKKVSFTIQTAWKLIIFFAFFIGAYVIYKEIVDPFYNKQKYREPFKTKGLSFYQIGNYKQARPFFEKAYSKGFLKPEEKLLFASLLAQEADWEKASLVRAELDSSRLKTGHGFLLNGLISFFQDDFSQAEENWTMAVNQKQNLAWLNLSLLKWRKGNYKQSLFYLDKLLTEAYERDIVFYLRALNLLSQNRTKDLISYIDRELFLGKQNSLVLEYTQELYLLLAYSYMKEQKPEKSAQAVYSLLNEDPFFEEERGGYSSFVAVKSLNWASLYPYCESLWRSHSSHRLLGALYGFCSLKAGYWGKASKYIEQVQEGKDKSLFLSLKAYLLMQKDEDSLAERALSLIDYDKEREKLPFIIKARFLEKKQDWLRALALWEKLLALSEGHLSGLTGVAIANYELGHKSKGDIYKSKALEKYPYHIRLLSYDIK